MAAQTSQCVSRLYKSVIEEVINGVKADFLDLGIEENVLSDLRHAWEQRLSATKVTEHADSFQQPSHASQTQQQTARTNTQGTTITNTINLVPVQITVPAQQAGGVAKTITIHIPSNALANGVAGTQLQRILSSPSAAQTFAMEANQAAEVIQRQLNTALQQHNIALPPQLLQYNTNQTQVDGPVDWNIKDNSAKKRSQRSLLHSSVSVVPQIHIDSKLMDSILISQLTSSQVDGTSAVGDSSDEFSDDDDDDEDDRDEEDDRELDEEDDVDAANEDTLNDDPLNSDDDVSDDEPGDVIDTDNVVVCQYEKITRVRTKWKFQLKDGIMNLKGKDYVFQKATGEGEW